ncbi:MAG: dTDP-4-dehydrorhamnose 3,5-epimerase [Lentisphaerae bacterium]|nr:dTDP-4-dehydrorhamnose 3,5-epimerase [Lentisphaerota bacterium]
MKIIECAVPEVKVIIPDVFGDERGYFFESWNEQKFAAAGIFCRWVQDNESRSRAGVIRGLHYQLPPYTQAKLVRVIEGKVLDVAVDIRKDSPTFGRYAAVELSGENKYQLFIPRGFAHGFAVLSETVVFAYKCDNIYMPASERGIAWDDPQLGINWQIPAENAVLSGKDRLNPVFAAGEFFDGAEYLR